MALVLPSKVSGSIATTCALVYLEPACGCLQAGGLSSFVSLQPCMREVCSPSNTSSAPLGEDRVTENGESWAREEGAILEIGAAQTGLI